MNKQLSFKTTITINANIMTVWDALVNPDIIKKYLFGTNAISEWKQGSQIQFKGEWQGTEYSDKGVIQKIEKDKILQYTYWSSFSQLPDTPENYSTVTFELADKGPQTELQLTQHGFANEEARDHSSQNWTGVLNSMKSIVEGQPA